MRLRSLTKHIKDQNWFAVALDFFIVVVGILIAFQITNWSEAVSERRQEKGFVERLHSDLMSVRDELDQKIAFLEGIIPANAKVHQMMRDSPAGLDRDELNALFENFGNIPGSPGLSDTYAEIQASGKMALISNEALRVALVEHATMVRDSQYAQQARREFTRPYAAPIVRFVALLDDLPAEKAFAAAGDKNDMLVAITMYETIVSNEIASFKELREGYAGTIHLLEVELKSP
jgi:Family of unknown function (DUF6090)